MKPIVLKLLLVVAALAFALFIGYAIGLTISGNQAIALLTFFVAVALILFFMWMRHGKFQDDFVRAKEYAVKSWNEQNSNEKLTREDWEGIVPKFGQDRVYIFKMKRASQIKAGHHAMIAVSAAERGFEILWMNDAPTPEQIKDPVKAVEMYLHATPVATKEVYPKYLDQLGPPRKKRGGTTINVGAMGGTSEPQKEESDD